MDEAMIRDAGEELEFGGEVEFEELDEADSGVEMELLLARVAAARVAGA